MQNMKSYDRKREVIVFSTGYSTNIYETTSHPSDINLLEIFITYLHPSTRANGTLRITLAILRATSLFA